MSNNEENRNALDNSSSNGINDIDELVDYLDDLGVDAYGEVDNDKPNTGLITFSNLYQIELFVDYVFYYGYGDGDWSALEDFRERVQDGETWRYWTQFQLTGDTDNDIPNLLEGDMNLEFPLSDYPLILEAIKKYWEEIGQYKKSENDD